MYQYSSSLKESAIFKEFTELDEAKNNLVKFVDHFVMKRDFCLVFELLDKSLCDFMKKRCYLWLRVAEIRVVMQQMLVTLNALQHTVTLNTLWHQAGQHHVGKSHGTVLLNQT